MTKSGLEMRKIRMEQKHDKEERAKERQFKKEEGRKDRIQKYVQTAVGKGGVPGMINGAKSIVGALLKNDPVWYKNYLKDLDAFVHLPTYDRLGATHFGRRFAGNITLDTIDAVPGIMVLGYFPMTGNQDTNLLAASRFTVNIGLARFKEKILALNSRSSVNWEPSDLGLNIYCSADIMSILLELRRVISVYNTYYARNAYLARALITALGWDYDDIVANIAEYRKLYQKFAKRFNTAIVAPRDVSLFARRAFLASNVFIDSEDKDNPRQIYVYSQTAYLTLNEIGDGADLTMPDFTDGFTTFQGYVNLMFERIVDNPDYIEMYQDLRHAIGDNLVTLPEDILNVTIEFNNEDINREQIHNFKTIPYVWSTSKRLSAPSYVLDHFSLRQTSDGYLYQGPSGSTARRFTYGNTLMHFEDFDMYVSPEEGRTLLNMHKTSVSGDDILDISRWCYTATYQSTTTAWLLDIMSVGTELGVSVTLYRYVREASGVNVLNVYECGTYNGFDEPRGMTALAFLASSRSVFDWAPIMHIQVHCSDNDWSERAIQSFLDAYTTFTIGASDIRALNEACVLSEVYLPDVGYIS